MPVEPTLEGPAALACKNISAGGLSGVCASEVRTGAIVVVALPELHGGVAAVRTRVTRCERDNRGYVWSMEFLEPVDIGRFVAKDPMANEFVHEFVAAHMIRGRIALLSESAHDRALFNMTLRGASCVLTTHESFAGLCFDAKRLDVVVLASDLQALSVSDAMMSLIAAESNATFVLLAADRSAQTRRLVNLLPFKAVLVKPCSPQAILSALAQALGVIAVRDEERVESQAA